ncbi:MAG: UvrB/UvrC motif-containing protein [Patescibacteria group bacterium]
MLCDRCRERQASVHITQIVNNKRLELNLCEACYQKEAGKFNFLVQHDLNFQDLLAGLLQFQAHEEKAEAGKGGQCGNCGLTYDEFGKVGQFGCGECYKHFAADLEPILRRIHGNTVHVGKVPKRTGGQVRVRKEIEDLKARLQEAVAREAYEEAAKLRDEIHGRERELKG